MLAPVVHIHPLTLISRPRTLPVPGRVLVRPGQKVSATDVIAEASVASQHLVLDLRQGLGIPEMSAAERCVVRQPGDRLEKGDVIAQSGGMFARIVRAPVECEIVTMARGQILLRTGSKTLVVKAGCNGTVTELIDDRGAVVEANGALVQGTWGNNRIDSGLLVILARGPQEELQRTQIDISMRGAVVLAGMCSSADALRSGADQQLRGLILSSLTADLIPLAGSLDYPIFVMEGFGRIPMNGRAHQLLLENEKQEIAVNASFDPAGGERPELVIELPGVGQPAHQTSKFTAGQAVRVQGAPYTGRIGTIVQLRPGLSSLPGGLRAQAADIQLDGEARVTIPLANLEVIQ